MVSCGSLNLSSDWSCDSCQVKISGREAMEFDNNLAKEGKKINKFNLANIEKFIDVYSKLLSENHVFLLQLKTWMVEGLNRLPYKTEGDVLLKKLKLIKEVQAGMKPFECTYSYLNGVLSIELTDTIVQKLFQLFGQESMVKNLDPMQMIQEAQDALSIAEVVFKHEDAKSQDHALKMKICDLRMALSNFR